jgi:hypothetical protein
MTLADLHNQLALSFPEHARKDLKTAIRVLARALECSDPEHCSLDQFNQPLSSLYILVERHLIAQGKKPHTVRNIKNYLSRLFRLAAAQHLLSLPPAQLLPRYDLRNKPRDTTRRLTQSNGISLLYHHWPADLQHVFTTFATWATAPLVPGRNVALKKRSTTINNYRRQFEAYFGFLTHVQHVTPVTFEHLFDITLITNFVHWRVNDLHHRPTKTVRNFLTHLLALTRQYRPLPQLRAELLTLRQTLPIPSAFYNKEDAWVSLSTLHDIACSLWPYKQPKDIRQRKDRITGCRFAADAGLSLMLRLWTYIPYRQRNMREMRLGENLHKDVHGTWRITFRGEQLKVAQKRGRTNVFDVPFPAKLVPVLEDYLSLWRPILLAKAGHPDTHVFLTQQGTAYGQDQLWLSTTNIVYRYTGQHWYPHIIRTVWATEWIRNGGDFMKAAIMLNDTLETVIKNYAHLREENVAEEVFSILDKRNGQGKYPIG